MAKKGRTSFTIAEINRLHQLFIEKDQTTDQDEKKAIRTKMRRIGFYISDFSYDMNSTDFELLRKNGDILIINYNEYVKSNCEDKEQSKMTKIHDCHNHKEGLAPWIDEFSEILILGSLPSDVCQGIRQLVHWRPLYECNTHCSWNSQGSGHIGNGRRSPGNGGGYLL